MIYKNFGIYSGAEITKSGNSVFISPTLIRLPNGELRGFGSFDNTVGKTINVAFSSTQPSQSGYDRENVYAQRYLLTINTTSSGQAWIYYNEVLSDVEVVVSSTSLPLNTIVLGKLTWNSGASSVNDITIDLTSRIESYYISTSDPSNANLLYQDGQPFTASAVNRQYANVSVLAEVLQDQSLLSFSDKYFVTFAKEKSGLFNGDIYGNNLTVFLNKFKNLMRDGNTFGVFFLKENPDLSPSGTSYLYTFPNLTSVSGNTIYVSINKSTAIPQVSTSFDSNTSYLIAYAQVGLTETDLANVTFKIVNNLIGHNAFVENTARLVKSQKTNGFIEKFEIEELDQDNKIRIKPSVLNIDGYLLVINGEDVTLPDPPASGSRQDFVYVEVKKQSIPWTVLSYEIKIVSDIKVDLYNDPFKNPDVKNEENNTYLYSTNGDYIATLSTNEVDGKTHAIPLAVIQRFTTQSFSVNYKGGFARIDGKSATRIKLSEIAIKAPVNTTRDKVDILNSAIFKLLSGNLNNQLKPAYLDSSFYSRSPLQIDRLGSNTSVLNTTFAGLTDGIRYLWSKNTDKPVFLYAFINEGTDSGVSPYNFNTVTYDTDSKTIIIQVPTNSDAELVRLQNGDLDGVSIKWASTGKPVKLSVNWSIGQTRTSTAIIDVTDVDYVAGDNICIMFKVRYVELNPVGLSQIPSKVIAAALNGNFSNLSDNFSIALNDFTTPKKVKDLARVSTINSINYTDYISLIKMGSNTKFYTNELHYFTPGNNSNSLDYEINAELFYSSDQYNLLGLIDVKNAVTGESLEVTKVKWSYNTTNKFLIRLALNIPVSDPVEFIFGVSGKQIDLSKASLEISNLTETNIQVKNASIVTNDTGIYYFTDGKISYGALALRSDNSIYVGEDLVPCKVDGFGTNLLKVIIQVDDISTYTTGNWYFNSSILKYVPNNGATLRLPCLESYMTDNNHIHIAYEYNSLPFIPFKSTLVPYSQDFTSESELPYTTAKKAHIINRGFLLKCTDGAANEGSSEYSPVAERFPVVQGISNVGLNVQSSPIGLTDVFLFQQQRKPFLEGQEINFNADFILSGNVQAGSGIAVWMPLIKQLNCLRLFIYQVRDGSFVINNEDQAFVCELEENYREKI